MTFTAIAMNDTSYTSQWWRQAMVGGIFAHAGDPVSALPGVVAGLAVSFAGGNNVTIAPGAAVITPVDGMRGSYLVSNDTSVTWPALIRDATYSRIVSITVRVMDKAHGDAVNQVSGFQFQGVPSVTPQPPAIPDGTLLLADILVPPSGDPAVIDRRMWTAAIGGAMSGTRAQRLALPTTHLRPGQTFTENADTASTTVPGRKGQTWRWSGSQWLPDFVMGFRAYVGQVQRDNVWDYQLAIPAGRVMALPLRKTSGPNWGDQRNSMDCTITNGLNVQVPYAGRYQIFASVAADATVAAEFNLQIRRNLNASGGSPGADVGAVGSTLAGQLLDDKPMYMARSGANSVHTVHGGAMVPQYEFAAGDSVSLTLWHNATSTQQVRYENAYVAFLELIRLGH